MAEIATTAVVDRGAELDEGVTIGPYAIVGPHVRIGAGTTVGAHAILDGHTEIGRDCRIFPHAAVGMEPQDLKYHGEPTGLKVGDRTVVREFASVHRATHEGSTLVGSDCLIMATAHVAHNCTVGHHVILANCVALAGHVSVGDYAIVGGVTPVHQFVRIGAHSMIGGGSRIPQDVAPYTRVAGSPPEAFGINVVGLSRRGFTPEAIVALRKAYRIIFRSKLTVPEAIARVESEVPPCAEVSALVEFMQTTKRGVIR
jgi:UDP-N-acetylglucosamine acyltransferase